MRGLVPGPQDYDLNQKQSHLALCFFFVVILSYFKILLIGPQTLELPALGNPLGYLFVWIFYFVFRKQKC